MLPVGLEVGSVGNVLITVVGPGAVVLSSASVLTAVDSEAATVVDSDSGGISKPSRSGRRGPMVRTGLVVTSSSSVGGAPLESSGNGLGKTCLEALSGSSCRKAVGLAVGKKSSGSLASSLAGSVVSRLETSSSQCSL